MIYYAVPRNAKALPPAAVAKVNAYLRAGGAFFVDTRDAAPGRDVSQNLQHASGRHRCAAAAARAGDACADQELLPDPVFPGSPQRAAVDRERRGGSRYAARRWRLGPVHRRIGLGRRVGHRPQHGQSPLRSMDGGENAREMAYRFGINLVMYILTGNYKEDQVHIPDLLDRLGTSRDKAD
jgi:hypothetical protein